VKKSDLEMIYREQHIVSRVDNSLDVVPPIIPENVYDFLYYSGQLTSNVLKQELSDFYVPSCTASTINIECPASGTFSRFQLAIKSNPVGKKALLGSAFKPTRHLQLGACSNDHNQQAFLSVAKSKTVRENPLMTEGLLANAGVQN
jgi:hypothetical protein